MTTQEKIEVMKAYTEGKRIQIKANGCMGWDDCFHEPIWDWFGYIYRIKPEEKYRPYKDTDEMIADFSKRAGLSDNHLSCPNIWLKYKRTDECSLIVKFCESKEVHVNDYYYSMDEIFNCFTYLDGSPCGIKE